MDKALPTTSAVLKRGFSNKCPKCGEGAVLHRYTVPYDKCAQCNQDYKSLRADDGPAWATILISGHLASPFMFLVLDLGFDNLWLEISLCIAVIVLIAALILPKAKSVFMAIIWLTSQKSEDIEDKEEACLE